MNDKKKITFDDWENTSDFLARQIVDDLYRAGLLDAHVYQGVVEKTLVNWPDTGRTWGARGRVMNNGSM